MMRKFWTVGGSNKFEDTALRVNHNVHTEYRLMGYRIYEQLVFIEQSFVLFVFQLQPQLFFKQ
jgi:hypothetical protein